jgi:hypothetical protein
MSTSRERYIVFEAGTCGQEGALTVWLVRLRRADKTGPPFYLHFVAQKADLPAPYAVGQTTEIDPRLLDQE